EEFLGEMGKSGYYNDPWYQKLVIQPGGHNCILVNGNPESQRAGDLLRDVSAWKDYASITDFTTFDGGAFVSGRLERIYKDTLEYLRRSALYIEPRTVVLIDEILGTTSVNTVELRFHAPMKEDITVSGNDAHITRPAGTLTIRTLTEGSTPKIMKRPLTITEFGSENAITMKSRGFLQLTAELNGNTRETTFVNVLSTDSTLMANLNEKNYSDHAVISINGAEYYINTSNGATAGKAFTEGMITTDALVYSLRPEGYIAIRATNLEVEGEKLFSSEKPISLVIRDSTIMTIGYSASEQTELWLKFTSKPKRVTLDGNKYRDWKYSRKSGLRLELPAGSGMIGIM
ncbi:MAG: hypothetical protein HOC71_16880, partial [Candidatus Latescibacteria bacterium]|nr:hypothetical protein [Candidatus Latescibacterota bacterium]